MNNLIKRLKTLMLPSCAKFSQQYTARPLTDKARTHKPSSSPEELPRISIVIPSYNQGEFIDSTLNSILDQKYPNIEVIVIDGGSDDRTIQILNSRDAQITYWISEEDRGQAHAINKGMQLASGEILAWLNSDDILLNHSLWKVADIFLRCPDLDVIYGHRVIIDEKDYDIGKWIMPNHSNRILYYADFVPQETMFWRRTLWEKVGNHVDESYKFALDWDLLLRFIAAGARFKRLNCFMGGFRRHGRQKTIVDIDTTGFEEMDRLRLKAARDRLGLERVPHFRMRLSILIFLFRAKVFETIWRIGLIKIV